MKSNSSERVSGSEVAMGRPTTERSTSKLTEAEKRVLGLVSRAKTNKEIAADLRISPSTVKRHLENLLRKLQLRNRVEAAIYGLMIAGCPSESTTGCPLELWHRRKNGR